jgi:hypothetical protein
MTAYITEYRDTNEYLNKRAGYANIPVDKLLGQALWRFSHMYLMLLQYIVIKEFATP